MDGKLIVSFDINVIEHLGIKLYSTIPPMIAELVSNAWDADAKNVYLNFVNGDDKYIEIKDDGLGMSFDELNEHFLKVGRNRRTELNIDETPSGRKVLGKKGLGKLSMFGIGKVIIVRTIKNGLENAFEMSLEDIKNNKNDFYEPRIITNNVKTDEDNGTQIIIKQINRKSDFDLESIRISLLKRFKIFSEDFVVHINNEDSLLINRNLEQSDLCQFKWIFPDDFEEDFNKDNYKALFDFGQKNNVSGVIMTSATPLANENQGIVLYSRNKLVQENKKFNDKGNNHFFQYMFGSFDVDFIDEKNDIDNCSTDRKSLTWDKDENAELSFLYKLIERTVIFAEKKWRQERYENKVVTINKKGIDIKKWLSSLNESERPLASKLTNAIIDNTNIDDNTTVEYISSIKDMYGFQSFKDFTQKLSDLNVLSSENAIKLLTDWKTIEDKEYAKIAIGRIKTIDEFEKFIKEDASETKVIQKFLEEFPWLLDPKMSTFEREVTYSKILKEKFPDDELPEHDRRIDFLCTNNSGVIHIIELKRPSIKITDKQISQIVEYVAFMKNKFPQHADKIEGYLISNNMNDDQKIQITLNGLKTQGIYVKSYTELLTAAREYNKKFYDKYYEIEDYKKITIFDYNI